MQVDGRGCASIRPTHETPELDTARKRGLGAFVLRKDVWTTRSMNREEGIHERGLQSCFDHGLLVRLGRATAERLASKGLTVYAIAGSRTSPIRSNTDAVGIFTNNAG